MTGWRKRTIIEMAREAGVIALNVECGPSYLPIIERFAALVLEDALTQPEQEPVAQKLFGYFQYDIRLDAWVQNRINNKGVAFYTKEQA